MPTYDMACEKCKRVHEISCPILERNNQDCPDCKGKLERIFTPPAVSVWKPDWWYVSPKEKLWIESKRQLFDECKKRNKYSVGYGQDNTPDERPPEADDLKTVAEVAPGGLPPGFPRG